MAPFLCWGCDCPRELLPAVPIRSFLYHFPDETDQRKLRQVWILEERGWYLDDGLGLERGSLRAKKSLALGGFRLGLPPLASVRMVHGPISFSGASPTGQVLLCFFLQGQKDLSSYASHDISQHQHPSGWEAGHRAPQYQERVILGFLGLYMDTLAATKSHTHHITYTASVGFWAGKEDIPSHFDLFVSFQGWVRTPCEPFDSLFSTILEGLFSGRRTGILVPQIYQ